MRIVGPNCLGVMVPGGKLNATFAADMARPGRVGFISQSGALCTAVLDWSLQENVGFSAFVSLGSMLDVGWGDLIYHLGDDPNTKSIVIYMETIGDARAFLSAAREVALTKPIIVIKPGRTAAAAKAAASHTGSLTGSDEVLQAAFQRVGVLRVDTISELFDMAEVLAKQPRPNGPHLTIVTNAGGPAVLATDMLITSGGQLADLTPETMAAFNKILPPTWSHNNPVDIIGDAGAGIVRQGGGNRGQRPEHRRLAGHPHAAGDDRCHGDGGAAQALRAHGGQADPGQLDGRGRSGGGRGHPQRREHSDLQISGPRGPRLLLHVALQREPPRPLRNAAARPNPRTMASRRATSADAMLKAVRKQGRTILTEFESKQLLAAYGIPTVETHVARTEAEAVKLADEHRLSRRAEALFGNHHAQDRRRRRAVEPAQGVGGAAGLAGHRNRRRRKRRARNIFSA